MCWKMTDKKIVMMQLILKLSFCHSAVIRYILFHSNFEEQFPSL